jgi:GT2 family glycosyltransferase
MRPLICDKKSEKLMVSIANSIPSVDIVILSYNCKRFLAECLNAVLSTKYPNFNVIFVDNNSSDGSVTYVKSMFDSKKVNVLGLDKNYGFAKGNNIGASLGSGDYIVFLNPDTKVDPEWLTSLVAELESDLTIGICQPKLLQMGSVRIDSTGGFINRFGFSYNRGFNENDQGQFEKVANIFYAKGAALIIRRAVWDLIGGFDPSFFIYFEETDLCWRVWEKGLRVVYIPTSIVYHAGGGILKKVPNFVRFHESKGRLMLLIKHYSLGSIFKSVSILVLFQLLNAILQIGKGNPKSGLSMLKGTLWCLTHFKKIWLNRQANGNNYLVPEKLVNFLPKLRVL